MRIDNIRFSVLSCHNTNFIAVGGTAPQTDGNKVRVSLAGSVASVNSANTVSCKVYYRLSSATAWTESTSITASNYAVSAVNRLLSQTFDALSSYELKVRLQDWFSYVEQTVGIGTKQVVMDVLHDGTGIAFCSSTPPPARFLRHRSHSRPICKM